MSKTEFKGSCPAEIFIVACDNQWRFFSSEGQASRWFALKINEGLKPTIYKFTNPELIAKVK